MIDCRLDFSFRRGASIWGLRPKGPGIQFTSMNRRFQELNRVPKDLLPSIILKIFRQR